VPKSLVLLHPAAGADGSRFAAGVDEEMAALRRLRDEGVLLEAYWPGRPGAVLILAAEGDEVERAVASLPFVRDGLLEWDAMPLQPFSALE
jgi:hypothetical protein